MCGRFDGRLPPPTNAWVPQPELRAYRTGRLRHHSGRQLHLHVGLLQRKRRLPGSGAGALRQRGRCRDDHAAQHPAGRHVDPVPGDDRSARQRCTVTASTGVRLACDPGRPGHRFGAELERRDERDQGDLQLRCRPPGDLPLRVRHQPPVPGPDGHGRSNRRQAQAGEPLLHRNPRCRNCLHPVGTRLRRRRRDPGNVNGPEELRRTSGRTRVLLNVQPRHGVPAPARRA